MKQFLITVAAILTALLIILVGVVAVGHYYVTSYDQVVREDMLKQMTPEQREAFDKLTPAQQEERVDEAEHGDE